MAFTIILKSNRFVNFNFTAALLGTIPLLPPAVRAEETPEPQITIMRAIPVTQPQSDPANKAPVEDAPVVAGDHVHWNSWARAGTTENEFSYGAELLAPFWNDERSVLFLYPKVGALDAGRQSYSMGIGGRTLLDSAPIILGANLFYDHSEGFNDTSTNQLGAGVEVLGNFWEFRANGYFNLSDEKLIDTQRTTETTRTTRQTSSSSQHVGTGPQYATGHSIVQQEYYRQTQTFKTTTTNTTRVWENFAQPMSGVDAEFGVLVPGLPKHNVEARLFVGGYYYANPFDGKDLSGLKARAEVRLGDRIYLDGAWAQDEEVMGGNWYTGIRVNIPFGAKPESSQRLSNGLHPLNTRLVEAVQRNARPVMATSGYRENVDLRDVQRAFQVRKAIRVVQSTTVLQDNIDFVNNGDPTDLGVQTGSEHGNGTAENPHDSIARAAAQAAQQFVATGIAHTVMVSPTGKAYEGNVLITAPMRITGAPNSETGIWRAGLADVPTGGNPNYTVGFTGPLSLVFGGFEAHNVAGKVEIDGFMIRNGAWSGDGIVLHNVAESSIHGNNISVPGNGISVISNWSANHTEIFDNMINDNGGHGIRIEGQTAGQLTGLIARNDVSHNGGQGLDLRLEGAAWDVNDELPEPLFNASWNGNIENNRMSNNTGSGFKYQGAGDFTGNLLDNFFNENQGSGVEFANSGDGLVSVGVASNDITHNNAHGIVITGEHGSETIIPVVNNNLYSNGDFGYVASLKDEATLRGDVQDNFMTQNANGIGFFLGNDSQMNVSFIHNDANSSGTDGLVGGLDGGSYTGNISNNNFDSNGRHGINLYGGTGASNSVISGQINNNGLSHNGSDGLHVEMEAGNFSSSIFSNIADQNSNGLSINMGLTTLNLDMHDNLTNQNDNSGIKIVTHSGGQVWGPGIYNNTLAGDNSTSHNPAASLDVKVNGSTWNAGNIHNNLVAGNAFRGISLELTGTTTWQGDLSGNGVYNNAFAPYGGGTITGSGIHVLLANSGGSTLNITDNQGTNNGYYAGDAGLAILTDNSPGAWMGNITGNSMNENLQGGIALRSTATGGIHFTGNFQNNTARDNQSSGYIINPSAPFTSGGGTLNGGNSSLNNGAPDVFTNGFGL